MAVAFALAVKISTSYGLPWDPTRAALASKKEWRTGVAYWFNPHSVNHPPTLSASERRASLTKERGFPREGSDCFRSAESAHNRKQHLFQV
ncbi:hypothetical protein M758_2G191700 [Ceratodon purpureus]|nr:hypothetical protein M758_2G191700 [Ceratodon purpureus]